MKITLFVVASLLMIGTSFMFGANVGADTYILADASNKATYEAALLRKLRAGEVDELISIMETDLNAQIENHAQFLDSPFNWLFPGTTQNSKLNMDYVFKYRLEFLTGSSRIDMVAPADAAD